MLLQEKKKYIDLFTFEGTYQRKTAVLPAPAVRVDFSARLARWKRRKTLRIPTNWTRTQDPSFSFPEQ